MGASRREQQMAEALDRALSIWYVGVHAFLFHGVDPGDDIWGEEEQIRLGGGGRGAFWLSCSADDRLLLCRYLVQWADHCATWKVRPKHDQDRIREYWSGSMVRCWPALDEIANRAWAQAVDARERADAAREWEEAAARERAAVAELRKHIPTHSQTWAQDTSDNYRRQRDILEGRN
jgi:hypothetical protein